MSEESKKRRDERPLSERAGLRLHRAYTQPVMLPAPSGKIVEMGYIDKSQSLYQGGGELREIIFLPYRLLSVPIQLWHHLIRQGVKTWEMIDHDANVSYRVSVEIAQRYGREYSTSQGKRWGVGVEHCRMYSATGEELTAQEAARVEPPKPPKRKEDNPWQTSMDWEGLD